MGIPESVGAYFLDPDAHLIQLWAPRPPFRPGAEARSPADLLLERPPPAARVHSSTSSALTSREGGIVSPSARAVLRLTTRLNFVGCSTGSSPALAPLRILAT